MGDTFLIIMRGIERGPGTERRAHGERQHADGDERTAGSTRARVRPLEREEWQASC